MESGSLVVVVVVARAVVDAQRVGTFKGEPVCRRAPGRERELVAISIYLSEMIRGARKARQ